MATIRKRNNKYQVQVRIRGKGTSATFKTLDLARRWARYKEIEFEKNIKIGIKYHPKTLCEILDKYKKTVVPFKKSASSETFLINAFMRNKWVVSPLNMLSAAQIAEYRDNRLLSVKPSTISREFGIVKHALQVAKVEWDWEVPIDLFAGIRLPQIHQRAVRRINDHDLKTLLEEASKHSNMYLKPIILIAINTAMRRGEILSLKWSDIDLKRNLINIDNTKSGYARSIKINNDIKRILENLEVKNDRVFPISVNSLRLCYQRLCNKINIKIRFHDFRHEAISRLFEQNLTIPHIASISGHRTMSQLFRYAHFKGSF